jgi:putative hydrolase of the HAD superfamily
MIRYQHYSFDLWLTLIRSNPQFKEERAKFFFRKFNRLGKDLAEVKAVFRSVDVMCNTINEFTGKNIDADEMYLMVISLLNEQQFPLREIDLDALCSDMDALVFNYLPEVYCGDTAAVLEQLRADSRRSISILSNTGFIRGEVLRRVLDELGLSRYFNFQLYSDEAGMSKPNEHFFRLMIDTVLSNRGSEGVTADHIIHVGDNPNADVAGATAAGISAMLVNSNDTRILNLIYT